MRKLYSVWIAARYRVGNVSYGKHLADCWDQTVFMANGLVFPLLNSGAKITAASTVKKPPLSLFLLSVQFRENCRYSCSTHGFLPPHFPSSCVTFHVSLNVDRIQLNSQLIKKKNNKQLKTLSVGGWQDGWEISKYVIHPFRAAISNQLSVYCNDTNYYYCHA